MRAHQTINAGDNNNEKCADKTDVADKMEANSERGSGHNSYMSTLFHILAVSIGPIVFSVPLAFSMVGYAFALAGIAVVGLVYAYNLRLYLKCCDKLIAKRKLESITFAESVKYALEESEYKVGVLAPFASQFINVLMLMTWGGELSFNVIFMCFNLQHVVNQYTTHSVNIHTILLFCAIPCTLISSFPKLRLSFLSIVAGTIDIIFLGFVLFELYFNESAESVTTFVSSSAEQHTVAINTLDRVPKFLAVILFTLNFSGIVLPLKSDMKRSEKFNARFGTMTVSVIIICVVNSIFGLLGYLRYGSGVEEMITLNLPKHDLLIQIMIGLYCAAIFFTYPVYFLVVFKIIWDEWMPWAKSKNTTSDSDSNGNINSASGTSSPHWSYECAARVGLNCVLFFIMLVFPDIETFTNIGGLICAILNSIIVPALVQILLIDEQPVGKTRRCVIIVRNNIVVIVGLILLYFGLVECYKDIVEAAT